MAHEVERYRKATRMLHHVHTAAFIVLFLTGLVLFIPKLGFIAQGGWTRVLHRIASILFIILPIIYAIFNWGATRKAIKEAFTWGAEDIGWLKAAPGYYFFNDESKMPPQGHMNTGQKMWWLMVLVFGLLFIISGIFMWFLKGVLPSEAFQWMVFFHDVSFIVSGCMLFVHVYLGVIHPLMTEAWKSITKGTVSAEYAKAHHGKWFKETTKRKAKGR